MGSGTTSTEAFPGRLIVSLDLEERPIELMVAQGDGIQEVPEVRLLATHLLAVRQLLLGAAVLPRRLLYIPQELPLALGSHHLGQARARNGPRPAL